MRSNTTLLTDPDKPLGRIILVPLDRIPVVHRELVVEVVVALTDSDKRSEHMVTRRMLVIERCFSEPVGERINAKGRLQARIRSATIPQQGRSSTDVMDKDKSKQTRIYVPAHPVSPPVPSDKRREHHSHEKHQLEVVSMLPPDNIVLGEIAHVCYTGFTTRLDDHPADVRPKQALMGIVRVKIGVGVPVVRTMTTRPPSNGSLNSTCAP